MDTQKRIGAGQIIAGSSIFCALVGVMIVQWFIPGGRESMEMTVGGVVVGFLAGLVGSITYTRKRKKDPFAIEDDDMK